LASPLPRPNQLQAQKNQNDAPRDIHGVLQFRRTIDNPKLFVNALVAHWPRPTQRIGVMDGDTKNYTYFEKFSKKFPHRLRETVHCEAKQVGMSRLAQQAREGAFASTFACF